MPVWLKEWWPVILVVVNVLGMWLFWSLSKKFVSHEHCGKCRQEFDDRLRKAETHLGSLPSSVDLGGFALDMERLRGDLKEVRAIVAGLRELFAQAKVPLHLLLEGHLRDQKDD